MQGIPDDITTPTSRQPLVVDEEFINHVLDRFKWQQIALRDIEPVRIANQDMLALIGQELGN